MDIFAERLKELRIENKLSQTKLSKATGLSRSSIEYWETKQQIPRAKAIIALAKYFGVSTDYLLGVTDY